ncbi:hypothetical protein OAM67_01435 [bacterium]|nr:hypothetical protein [bacterium]
MVLKARVGNIVDAVYLLATKLRANKVSCSINTIALFARVNNTICMVQPVLVEQCVDLPPISLTKVSVDPLNHI